MAERVEALRRENIGKNIGWSEDDIVIILSYYEDG